MSWPCTGNCPDGTSPFSKTGGTLGLNIPDAYGDVDLVALACDETYGVIAPTRGCARTLSPALLTGATSGIDVSLVAGQTYQSSTPTKIVIPSNPSSCQYQFVHLTWDPTSTIVSNGADYWCVEPLPEGCTVPEGYTYPPVEPRPGIKIDYLYRVLDSAGGQVQGYTQLLSEQRQVIGDHFLNTHQTFHLTAIRPPLAPSITAEVLVRYTGISEGLTIVEVRNESSKVEGHIIRANSASEETIFIPLKPDGEKVRGSYNLGTDRLN